MKKTIKLFAATAMCLISCFGTGLALSSIYYKGALNVSITTSGFTIADNKPEIIQDIDAGSFIDIVPGRICKDIVYVRSYLETDAWVYMLMEIPIIPEYGSEMQQCISEPVLIPHINLTDWALVRCETEHSDYPVKRYLFRLKSKFVNGENTSPPLVYSFKESDFTSVSLMESDIIYIGFLLQSENISENEADKIANEYFGYNS